MSGQLALLLFNKDIYSKIGRKPIEPEVRFRVKMIDDTGENLSRSFECQQPDMHLKITPGKGRKWDKLRA